MSDDEIKLDSGRGLRVAWVSSEGGHPRSGFHKTVRHGGRDGPSPVGLLLAEGEVTPSLLADALNEQGGPPWDRTEFEVVKGIDLKSLVTGSPASGTGTAIVIASTGWWVRPLDEVAQLVAKLAGTRVLALFEFPGCRASGYCLATPESVEARAVSLDEPRLWVDGVNQTLGASLVMGQVPSLHQAVATLMGDHPSRLRDLPPVFLFRTDWNDPHDRVVLCEVRGSALVTGYPWRPGEEREEPGEMPRRMKVIVLNGPVRLPGPPRWARAVRAEAIGIANEVTAGDGWVCLVPEFSGVVAIYGTAVRLLQFAPLADGSWLGVLEPLVGVRVGRIRVDEAKVRPVEQEEEWPEEEFAQALEEVIRLAQASGFPLEFSERELREHPDPAALLVCQIGLTAELGQTYLASSDPVSRLEILAAGLKNQPMGPDPL